MTKYTLKDLRIMSKKIDKRIIIVTKMKGKYYRNWNHEYGVKSFIKVFFDAFIGYSTYRKIQWGYVGQVKEVVRELNILIKLDEEYNERITYEDIKEFMVLYQETDQKLRKKRGSNELNLNNKRIYPAANKLLRLTAILRKQGWQGYV